MLNQEQVSSTNQKTTRTLRVSSNGSKGQPEELQQVLKTLAERAPKDCLDGIAAELQTRLNCETACILRWKEDTQQLITEHRSGMPEDLHGEEIYSLAEGITGKYVFNRAQRILALVDFESETLQDVLSGESIADESIRWDNMRRFKESSRFLDFRSLLSLPLNIRHERIGVIKLINKIRPQGDKLASRGFTRQDLARVDLFLDTIEHVLEAKRHEEQIEALLQINESTFQGKDAIKEIVEQCARSLNYRVCLIRLYDGVRLTVADCHSDLKIDNRLEPDSLPNAAFAKNRIVKWCLAHSNLESLYGARDLVSYRCPRFVDDYRLNSFVIVPIVRHNKPIGTIECYATMPRDIGDRELNVIRTFAGLVATALMNRRLSGLVEGLLQIQAGGVSAIDIDSRQEDEVVANVVRQIKDSLGSDSLGSEIACLTVLFSKPRLLAAHLTKCGLLHGIKSIGELKSVLRKSDFDAIASQPDSRGEPGEKFWRRKEDYARGRLHVYKVPISLSAVGPSVGVIILGVRSAAGIDSYSKQIVGFSATSLAVALENIGSVRRLEFLGRVVEAASRTDTPTELYRLILKGALNGFGFNFAAISIVDENRSHIKTIQAASRKPQLVDPTRWMSSSNYCLEDMDILPWIVREKQPVMIDGPAVAANWDRRLNRTIFEEHDHRSLVRLFVPLISRENIQLTPDQNAEKRDLVIGVIEAGYHVSEQPAISARQSEQFTLFINSCAENLQRLRLLKEQRQIARILKQIGHRESGPQLLADLLKQSVKFLGADSGVVMLLTHSDGRLVLTNKPITFNLPSNRESFYESLEVRSRGKKIGMVARAASKKEPYWSNYVKEDPFYLPEFEQVQSELAMPLMYANEVIGVLDIYSYQRDWFDSKKVELLSAIIDPAIRRYEKVRFSKALSSLAKRPFNIFSTVPQVYSSVLSTIRRFLDIDTVTVWQVDPLAPKGHEFKLKEASPELKQLYDADGITTLDRDSYTGRAALRKQTLQVTHRQIKSVGFGHSRFATKNKLKSMTVVPIATDHETYAAIDVFSRRDVRLFQDEVAFLEALANKAANAIFGAKLRESLEKISSALVIGDVDATLDQVTQAVIDLLHANLVILIEYDAEQKKLLKNTRHEGDLADVKKLNLKSSPFFNRILNDGNLYMKDDKEYLDMLTRLGQPLPSRKAPGFWRLAQIKSSAGLQLMHANETVGIMWVNYRTPRVFDAPQRRLVEGVAALAASAIANARLFKTNRAHELIVRRYSLVRAASELATGLEHTTGNFLHEMSIACHRFDRKLERSRNHPLNTNVCRKFLNEVREPLTFLIDDFERQAEFRTFGAFKREPCRLDELIDECLHLLRKQIQNIDVVKKFASAPSVFCDKKQVKQIFINLLTNSREAISRNGKIIIKMTVSAHRDYVVTRIEDNGSGVPRKLRPQVFEPFFTTKEGPGRGLGLSTSRFIAERNGGSLKLRFPRRGRGMVAEVSLPVERKEVR